MVLLKWSGLKNLALMVWVWMAMVDGSIATGRRSYHSLSVALLVSAAAQGMTLAMTPMGSPASALALTDAPATAPSSGNIPNLSLT